MKSNLNITVAALFATALSVGCSHTPASKDVLVREVDHTQASATVAAVLPESEYAVVKFQKGSYELSDSSRQEINRITIRSLSGGRKINEIKVLAWADREYPHQGTKANSKDVLLAGDRADVITSYIKNGLHSVAKVDEHNMAKRPGFLSELVKSEDFKLKNNLENSGFTKNRSTNPFLGKKESKGLVLITYE